MKKIGLIFPLLLAVGFLFPGNPAHAAAKQWIDATHIFDAHVQALVKEVKLETKVNLAKRKKAPIPKRKEYKIGDVETFWTKNIKEDKFEQTKAVLKALGTNCYLFLEEGKTLPDATLEKIQKTFDSRVYPTDTRHFGFEWKPGIDDDERITLLLFDVKDGFNGSGGYVGGYFFAGDEFLQSQIPENIPVKSNEREMFYLDIYPSDPTAEDYMAVVAHEFQHMIHFNHDPKERTWVNEACSQIAFFFNGYGHAPHIMSLLQTPDNSMTAWAEQQMIANYGQVYLWNYYITNRFLKTDDQKVDFYTKLVDSKETGIAAYDKALKKFGCSFEQVFTDFAVTNFINDQALGKGEFAYDKTLGRLKLPVASEIKTFPSQVQEKVFLWSADAIKADLSNIKKALKIEFAGSWAEFTPGKNLAYAVIAVVSNSRNTVKPKLVKMSLTPIPDKKIQVGVLEIKPEEGFDTLTLVISAQAPTSIPDEAYAKAPQIPYVLAFADDSTQAPQVARSVNTTSRSSNDVLNEYLLATCRIESKDEKEASFAFKQIDSLTSQITSTIKTQLDRGSLKGINDFTSRTSGNSKVRESLRPVAQKMADQLRFYKSHGKSDPEIESKIQILASY